MSDPIQSFSPAFDAQTVADILRENMEKNGGELALSGSGKYPKTELRIAAASLEARRKISGRLKEWFSCPQLVYPNSLCLEQCSSEITARYKGKILQDFLQTHLQENDFTGADLTGGLGIDTYYMSQHFRSYDYFERNPDLCTSAVWNFRALEADRISVHQAETSLGSIEKLIAEGRHYTSVFLDPARRDAKSSRVFGISDCEPDVLQLKEALFMLADVIMLKLSPMIDISDSLSKLENICSVHVISVRNECKEMIFLLKKGASVPAEEVPITATMIDAQDRICEYTFTLGQESQASAPLATDMDLAGQYLYEPDKAILKTGAFKKIAADFHLLKMDRNIHLYLSGNAPSSETAFPGKVYHIDEVFGMDKKSIRQIKTQFSSAEIITKNIPLSGDQLRKKIGIKDGPATHLFGLGLPTGHFILATSKFF